MATSPKPIAPANYGILFIRQRVAQSPEAATVLLSLDAIEDKGEFNTTFARLWRLIGAHDDNGIRRFTETDALLAAREIVRREKETA